MCLNMCDLNVDFVRYALPHPSTVHINGLSPVWIPIRIYIKLREKKILFGISQQKIYIYTRNNLRSWSFSSELDINPLSQYWHRFLKSLVCVRVMWVFTCSIRLYEAPHVCNETKIEWKYYFCCWKQNTSYKIDRM